MDEVMCSKRVAEGELGCRDENVWMGLVGEAEILVFLMPWVM